jgi:hypothetical protein
VGDFQAEDDDFDRKRSFRTEPIHHLSAVDDDREAMACGRDDFLAQQGSA